jgi:hypothetical protein
MRPYIVVVVRAGGYGPEVIEENEGTDGTLLQRRQQAPHHEAAAQVLVV